MDLSNKSLALLLLAAIVISLGGTFVSINRMSKIAVIGPGYGQQITGQPIAYTTVNITTLVQCTIERNVAFGTSTSGVKVISSHANNAALGFNDCTSGTNCVGMELNNTGNVNLNVNFSSDVNASGFLGGPSVVAADFQFNMTNGTQPTITEPGCVNITSASGWAGYVNVPFNTETVICQNLTAVDSNDIINMEYRIEVRPDTPSGLKNATITINCNQN